MNRPDLRLIRPSIFAACAAIASVLSGFTLAEEPAAGERTFRERCASCHGDKGEGAADHDQPLLGDKSVAELAKIIEETMPEDDPGTVVGQEATQVAQYIYDAFYSPVAQVRNAPPRIELSRLTVRQYQNAIADLLASFGSPPEEADEHGLEGEYYNDRRPRGNKRVIERTDAVVDFQFGEASPEPEKIGAEEFSIRWEGGLFAPDTGEYELIVRTENAMRLWVNDPDEPLIDAWVRSGDGTEFRETVRLLGGRVYPLRLDFFKSKREKTSSISLQWKPPHRTEEVIPERSLVRGEFNKLLVIATPFPPDDRSMGYERGTAISKEWDQATTFAAIETAGYVAANLNDLADSRSDSSDRSTRVREFCRTFVERAFRRPLDDEERTFYVDRHFEGSDEEAAVKRVVLLSLKSPQFLYREFGGGDEFDTASRLAMTLWDSLPDRELLDAAAQGELKTLDQIRSHAERMVKDPRARSKVRAFLHQWLRIDHLDNISKDGELFPEFDEQAVSDLRTSLDLFLDDVVWSESSDYRQLLLADSIYLNGRLSKLYGADLPENAPFTKVAFDPEQRAGVLTHPLLLTGFAYHGTSSPIHRGVFVARSLLGRMLKPPPVAVAPISPDLHPDLTTRERVTLQTSDQMCQSCHTMINALGFPMEHFDAIGGYRTEEKGKPVDATGIYQSVSGSMAEFAGVRDLAAYLAASDESQTAFVQQMFHALVKQPIFAHGAETLQKLRQSFVEDNFNMQRLIVNIAVVAATQHAEEAKSLTAK